MKKYLFCAFIVLAGFSFARCNNGGGDVCCAIPKDLNGDCKCDNCGMDWTTSQTNIGCTPQVPK